MDEILNHWLKCDHKQIEMASYYKQYVGNRLGNQLIPSFMIIPDFVDIDSKLCFESVPLQKKRPDVFTKGDGTQLFFTLK